MRLAIVVVLALGASPAGAEGLAKDLHVEPGELKLVGSDARGQLVVTGRTADGQAIDRTESASYQSRDPKVVKIEPGGLVRPTGDGATTILVRDGENTAEIHVEVRDFEDQQPIHFATEVVPVFTKLGCNNGMCHGKASGQNGFKLSLLGFDPKLDYDALVREGRGRRVFPAAPEQSLVLAKPSAKIPHGGGRKLETTSTEYRTLLRWLKQGMPFDAGKEPKLIGLSVSPDRRTLGHQASQQLRVTASYDDGSTVDVTRLAQYQTNAADLASVDENGRIQTRGGVGVAAIMVRFGGQVTVSRLTVPLGVDVPPWEAPESDNLIDPLVFGKLKELGLPPSEACTDAEFARRSALDICGILPKPEEVIAFAQDTDPNKRSKWVDRLLERPEYADLFAMKWSAILRNKRFNFFGQNPDGVTFAFHAWIREAIAENKPYDQFAAEIVAARGDATVNPPVAWYRASPFNPQNTVEEKVDDTAQLFLGLRIQCARCHHHPFEKWSQDDYYGFASFFSRIGRKPGNDPTAQRIFTMASGLARNPMNGREYKPKPLDGPELGDLGPFQDPRQTLADWLRRPDNPFLARAVVNRYWKHFFGRGLVEPEDDMRITNPPSNPELLDALSAAFVKNGYDLKWLVRTICTSRAYDRSSEPNPYNASDRQNFARYYPRRLPAEVLLDAIDTVVGSTEQFDGLPQGFRAAQLPDEGFGSYFLDVFGRPKRESVCECERSSEANLSQSLHLLNSDEVQQKLTAKDSHAARWAEDARPDDTKIEELYRLAFARPPTEEEKTVCLEHLKKRRAQGELRQGYEDLIATLINTKEFLLNH
jgi:hypothetical protein